MLNAMVSQYLKLLDCNSNGTYVFDASKAVKVLLRTFQTPLSETCRWTVSGERFLSLVELGIRRNN